MKCSMEGITVIILSLLCNTYAMIVSDDFEDGILDQTIWTVLDKNGAAVTENGGKLSLTSSDNTRPYLTTKTGWDPVLGTITVAGRVILGDSGSFAILTRSSGDYDSAGLPNSGGVIGSGVRFSFWLDGGDNLLQVFTKEDAIWPWTTYTTAAVVDKVNLTAVTGEWDVLVTDDGSTVSMTVTNVADPDNTGAITFDTTFIPAVTRYAIAFGNNGAVWDDITIEGAPVVPEDVEVYILAGQSNMQGLGKISQLTSEQQQPIIGAMFWNDSSFEQLNPLTTPLGTATGQFGPEINFARTMQAIDPNRIMYLIKYSSSGKALDSGWADQIWVGDPPAPNRWNFYPGLSVNDNNKGICYTQMLSRINTALTKLNDRNISYTVKGIVWMQGEQDSKNLTSATRYAQNLKRFSDRLRQDLGLAHTIPLVYGQVLPFEPPADRFTYRDEVRQSQVNADTDFNHADSFINAFMVPTDSCPVDSVDLVHYTTEGQMILGRDFAFEMSKAHGYVLVTHCGEWGYLIGDVNKDCKVNLEDLILLFSQWLNRTFPQQAE